MVFYPFPKIESITADTSARDMAANHTLSPREVFRDELTAICAECGLYVSESSEYYPDQIRIEFAPGFPIWIRIDVDEQTESAALVGVVRTFGFPGDRSDYHELISLVWAAYLRRRCFASVRLVDIPHPAVPGELYGRYLFFETQPQLTFFSLKSPKYLLIRRLLEESCVAAQVFSLLYEMSKGDPDRDSCAGNRGDVWVEKINDVMHWKADERNSLTNERQYPNWRYHYRDGHFLTAFELEVNLLPLIVGADGDAKTTIADFKEHFLVKTGDIRNTIHKKPLRKLCRLLSVYGVREDGMLSSLLGGTGRCLFLPTDSHLICFTERGVAAVGTEGGHETFVRIEAALRLRHQSEAEILNCSIQFQWRDPIHEERFEELALDLLNREPGVKWVRRVGAGRASDGGRDLIVDWDRAPESWESASETHASIRRKVIIQCKAYSSSINRTVVGDVPGTADLHDANGYLLIAMPRLTPQLIDYLRKVPAKRGIWADWWTKPEIEDRLRKNLDIINLYPDLIRVA